VGQGLLGKDGEMKKTTHPNVLAFEKGFNRDYYDTDTSDNYVLAPAFGTAMPEATTIMVKILVVQWTWTMRLNSYTKIGPRSFHMVLVVGKTLLVYLEEKLKVFRQ
jgi:hypothetical protein